MTITIKDDIALIIGLLSIKYNIRADTFNELLDKGLINDSHEITEKGNEILRSITSSEPKSDDFTILAQKMREVFPKGKKPGTNLYWRDSVPSVAAKLKTIVKRFGECFTEEQAVDAARRYVSSFNGDYQYMRLLPYFILKYENKMDEEGNVMRIMVSPMLSYIQNEGQEGENEDWNIEVR